MYGALALHPFSNQLVSGAELEWPMGPMGGDVVLCRGLGVGRWLGAWDAWWAVGWLCVTGATITYR